MTAASDTIQLDIETTRGMLRQGQARALVVGPEKATDAVIHTLRPDFGSPVVTVRVGEPLTFPDSPGTLLIHDASSLEAADQDRLLQWLSQGSPGMSVIAVISEQLFPLVQRGAFLRDLFYRLNLIVIDVTDGHSIDSLEARG